MLTVGTQTDTSFKLVHCIDMIHPVAVNVLEKIYSLKLTHSLLRNKGFVMLVQLCSHLCKLCYKIFLFKSFQLFLVIDKCFLVVLFYEPALERISQTLKVPVILVLMGQVFCHLGFHCLAYHIHDSISEVFSVKHLISLTVDDLTLTVHYIVKFKHALTYAEVPALDLGLSAFDNACQKLALQRLIILAGHLVHDILYPVACKESEDIILCGKIETACARVALTACTASELVVDTS